MTEQLLIDQSKENNLYLCFCIDDRTYAINTENVMEIIMLPQLNYPQKLPKYTAGILNYNNILLNVTDLRSILNFSPKPFEISNQIIIIKGEESLLAIIVDKVTEFYTVLPQNIQTIANTGFNSLVNTFCREGENIINIMDIFALERLTKNINEEENILNYRDQFPSDPKSKAILEKRNNNIALKSAFGVAGTFASKDQYLTFHLGKHRYCINADSVKEVISKKNYNITTIPYVPSYIRGVINLKGEFYTVFSLRKFIGIDILETTPEEKMIVLESKDMKIVLLVDEIGNILNIAPEKIHSQNDLKLNKLFIKSEIYMDNNIYNLLDMQRLLNDERIFVGKEHSKSE